MTELPLIEIFMPFYGDVDHFHQAVESVLNQSVSDWHLTIVDDNYPDLSAKQFIDSLDDSRIRYIRNSENLGIAANFQKCIQLASSPYITIMGCDDILLSNYVEHLKSLISSNSNCSYFQPGVSIIDQFGAPYLPLSDQIKSRMRAKWQDGPHSGESITRSLLNGNWTYFPSICWKVESIRSFGFSPNYQIVLDLDLQLNLLFSGNSVYLDDQLVFKYRRHKQSASMITSTNGLRFIEEKELFYSAARKANKLGWRRAKISAWIHPTSRLNAFSELITSLRNRKLENSRVLLKHVLF